MKVLDTSSEEKTADHLYVAILDVRKVLRNEWKVDVIAITSDAAGEAKKARRLCIEADPSLITPDCWAHQAREFIFNFLRLIPLTNF